MDRVRLFVDSIRRYRYSAARLLWASIGPPRRSRVWDGYVGRIEGFDGRAAEKAERAVDAFAEDLDGARDAGFSCGAETVGVGASDENGASAEAEGFDDVRAAADSAVEQNFRLTADSSDDLGQDAKSW